MKTTISRNSAYIGAGAGLALFAIFGLLPGSLLGGAAGLKFAGMLFGLPLDPGIVSRAIVLASMLVGALVSGIVIITATRKDFNRSISRRIKLDLVIMRCLKL